MKIKSWLHLLIIYLMGIGLYYPALNNFFTHDDFFHMKISQVNSIKDFLAFFNIFKAPADWGFYRPLTTQVFYFLNWKVFNASHIWMNVMAFLMFGVVMVLVYQLVKRLVDTRMALLTTWLYVTSATHFTHLYFVADQELGHAMFFLGSVILFIDYLLQNKKKKLWLAWLCFIGALMSRETAIMLPVALVIVAIWIKKRQKVIVPLKKVLWALSGFGLTLAGYIYAHVFHYGLVKGDSYIWVFSAKTTLNSLAWYGLWSLNLPQLLVDYIGPGFKINPNLMQFYGKEITLIVSLFGLLMVLLAMAMVLGYKTIRKRFLELGLTALWFACLLLPVLFLPWHKFTIFLTLPIIGVTMALGIVIVGAKERLEKMRKNLGKVFMVMVVLVYVCLSAATVDLTRKTHWAVSGAKVSRRVYEYFLNNYLELDETMKVYFFDRPEDDELPWKPSNELKVILSGNNFFSVFFDDKIRAYYVESEELVPDSEVVKLPARQFLGY